MTQLKTLKDFEGRNSPILTIPNLKAEAIKWVKFWSKEAQTHDTNYLLNKADALIEFCSITEEDLE